MIFDFTDDQRAFADSVGALLERAAGPSALRTAWASGARDQGLWDELRKIGLIGLLIDDELGGAGARAVDGALALEQVGYHAVAAPVAENAFVLPLLLRGNDDVAARSWQQDVAGGTATIASVTEADGIAAHASEAEAFLLIEGDAVHLVPRDEVTVERVESSDPSLGLGIVTATIGAESVIAPGRRAVLRFRAVHAMSSALTLVGTTQRLLDMTRRHVLERHQFGRQLGSFQAIKHRLADVAVGIEAARSLAWYAAYASEHEQDQFYSAALCAKASASSAAAAAGVAALQLHGGIGFTWEHDLHLFLQRARALEVLHGSRSSQREEVGRIFLDDIESSIGGVEVLAR